MAQGDSVRWPQVNALVRQLGGSVDTAALLATLTQAQLPAQPPAVGAATAKSSPPPPPMPTKAALRTRAEPAVSAHRAASEFVAATHARPVPVDKADSRVGLDETQLSSQVSE
jgi:hypothetical protein